MICALCLHDGRPLVEDPDRPDVPPAGAAITVEAGTAYCLEHWRTDASA